MKDKNIEEAEITEAEAKDKEIEIENIEIREDLALTAIEVINLKNPIKSGKEEITKIELDLSKVRPRMVIEAGREFAKNNPGFYGLKELNEEYQMRVASKLLNIDYNSLLNLEMKEFYTISRSVASFLMNGE